LPPIASPSAPGKPLDVVVAIDRREGFADDIDVIVQGCRPA